MGTGSFSGVKRPGSGVDHPPPYSVEVKEKVELYIYSPLWTFVASSRMKFTFIWFQSLNMSRFLGLFFRRKFSSDQPRINYKNNTWGNGKGGARTAKSVQWLSYGNDDRSNRVRCTTAKASRLNSLWPGYGDKPTSYPMDTVGYTADVKETGAWSCPLNCICCRS